MVTAVVVGSLVGIAVLIFVAVRAWEWWDYDRHAANIVITVGARPDCSDTHPIFVGVVNNSERILNSTAVSLAARRPGRSSDIAGFNYLEDDLIIRPGDGAGQCWRVSLSDDAKGENPRKLEWSVNYARYRFGDYVDRAKARERAKAP